LDLSPYIRELILLNECVILRGVGGFETTYKHAELNRKKKMLLPPSKQIHFHGEWISDNGVLEEYLADSLNISKEKASDMIDHFVQQFYNTLKKEGKIVLEGIGEFSLDKNQNILFKEIEDENYLADSFGLDILEIASGEEEMRSTRKVELMPVEQPKRKLTGWYILIGILLSVISITLIILLSEGGKIELFGGMKKKADSGNEGVIVFGRPSGSVADSISRSIESTLDEKTSARKALSIEEVPAQSQVKEVTIKVAPVASPDRYFLVAGSFNSRRNADILKDQLIRKGFQASIIETDQNVRVIIGSYHDRKKAIDELRRMRQQLDQSIWLLEL
jgi:nucleoid DNA-binding protein